MDGVTRLALETVLKQFLETKDMNQIIEDIENILIIPEG